MYCPQPLIRNYSIGAAAGKTKYPAYTCFSAFRFWHLYLDNGSGCLVAEAISTRGIQLFWVQRVVPAMFLSPQRLMSRQWSASTLMYGNSFLQEQHEKNKSLTLDDVIKVPCLMMPR